MVRPVEFSDANDICGIYNEYVTTSKITFEEQALSVKEVSSRIENVTRNYPWLVYEKDVVVVGYTYATEWKERSVYRHTIRC